MAYVFIAALILAGIYWVVVNLWWVIVLILAVIAGCWMYQRPGLKAKRALRATVRQGNKMRRDIRTATARTKAEIDQIAHDWHNAP